MFKTLRLYCIVLHCIVLYCVALYCIVLHCIVLYCVALYCIVLYCIVLYCIALYCIECICRWIWAVDRIRRQSVSECKFWLSCCCCCWPKIDGCVGNFWWREGDAVRCGTKTYKSGVRITHNMQIYTRVDEGKWKSTKFPTLINFRSSQGRITKFHLLKISIAMCHRFCSVL